MEASDAGVLQTYEGKPIYKTLAVFDSKTHLLEMAFSAGLLDLLLRRKTRALTPEERESFLAFASEVKKFYARTQRDPGITFTRILDIEKTTRLDVWHDIAKSEEQAMYKLASEFDADEWTF